MNIEATRAAARQAEDKDWIHVRDDGAVVMQSLLEREHPDADLDRLHRAIENAIVADEHDGEQIDWPRVHAALALDD